GMLKVSARERATGLQKQITIENALAEYEREERDEARERLEELWAGAEEEKPEEGGDPTAGEAAPPELAPGPPGGATGGAQAGAVLEKAERLLPQVQPEDRAEVEKLMGQLRSALTDRHWDKVTTASNELADILFYLDDA